jgi:hypothetical protein
MRKNAPVDALIVGALLIVGGRKVIAKAPQLPPH